jgi:hypothetical protein
VPQRNGIRTRQPVVLFLRTLQRIGEPGSRLHDAGRMCRRVGLAVDFDRCVPPPPLVANSERRLHSVLATLEECRSALVASRDRDTALLVSVAILELRMKLNRVAGFELKAMRCHGAGRGGGGKFAGVEIAAGPVPPPAAEAGQIAARSGGNPSRCRSPGGHRAGRRDAALVIEKTLAHHRGLPLHEARPTRRPDTGLAKAAQRAGDPRMATTA